MPTFQYEAMDHTGREVKDSIDAVDRGRGPAARSGRWASSSPRSPRRRKKTRKAAAKKGGRRKKKTFTIGRLSTKQLCTFTRQLSTLQDAGLPILRSLKILEGQWKPGVLKNALVDVVEDVEGGPTLSEAFAKHPKAFDRLYVQHGQGRRGRRRARRDPPAPGRLQGKGPAPEAEDQRRHGLPDRGHPGRRASSWASSCTSSSPSSRRSSRTSACPCRALTIMPDRRQPLPDQVLLHRLPDAVV